MEKVIIVHIQTDQTDQQFSLEVNELQRLVETAGGEVVLTLTQKRQVLDYKTLIGRGKLDELGRYIEELEAEKVIFYPSLTARQHLLIEQELSIFIMDRVQLILDIFAQRASSKVGQLQVELAQLTYLLPRIMGQGKQLSRLGGGIGTRGPGETKLEVDRRRIRQKIHEIERELNSLGQHRRRARAKRSQVVPFQIGLIGYTNAGKSTLLNALTDAGTYEKDELFATLDPLTRKKRLPSGLEVTITDTVGFIHDLPDMLLEAFQSTFEESQEVDLFVEVIDGADPLHPFYEDTVHSLLKDLEMNDRPLVYIYSKKDLLKGEMEETAFPSIQANLHDKEDQERILSLLESQIRHLWQAFDIFVAAKEMGKIEKWRPYIMLDSCQFDENKEAYRIKGYANHWWSRRLNELSLN
ncbi:GTPase HflX [Atopobacter sp. AH10]|uniref:GTPase HflX n=1 Tax=Atopobacter sp. AH10 TaxID=2315861 RepID=UPI000EF198FB|nr:GTPase HflX [Atopobacter sp. AH10]RLK62521.1 GTPase HflX [Atopobacter sp. AH10]